MKVVSEEHFATMKNMALYFERHAATDKTYLPASEAAQKINEIIETVINPDENDFLLIRQMLENAFPDKYSYGSHWYDYKIHVVATLRINGADDAGIM